MPLSDVRIRNAKPQEGEYELSDGGGLYLRVMSAAQGGGKYWILRYRVGKRRRKLGLGVFSNDERVRGAGVSLKAARELAKKHRDRLALGSDPIEEKQKRADAETVESLFALWKENVLACRPHQDGRGYEGRKDGGKATDANYRRHVAPAIGNRAADSITDGDLTAILKKLYARGRHRAARILFGEIRQMFSYAVANKIIPTNPAGGVPDIYRGKPAERRERVLSPDELRDLARKLPVSGLVEKYQAAAWLMLATCCRPGELSKAKWRDLDFAKGEWRIPSVNAKNNVGHLIHLSDFARRQFGRIPRELGGDWVFPGTREGEPISGQALQKLLKELSRPEPPKGRRKIIEAAGRKPGVLAMSGGDWTAHDLRRTGATLMGELGVPPHVTEKCLNHSLVGVMAVYQMQNLYPERRHAFRMLGEALEAAQRGGAVTPDEMADVVPIWASRRA